MKYQAYVVGSLVSYGKSISIIFSFNFHSQPNKCTSYLPHPAAMYHTCSPDRQFQFPIIIDSTLNEETCSETIYQSDPPGCEKNHEKWFPIVCSLKWLQTSCIINTTHPYSPFKLVCLPLTPNAFGAIYFFSKEKETRKNLNFAPVGVVVVYGNRFQ